MIAQKKSVSNLSLILAWLVTVIMGIGTFLKKRQDVQDVPSEIVFELEPDDVVSLQKNPQGGIIFRDVTLQGTAVVKIMNPEENLDNNF